MDFYWKEIKEEESTLFLTKHKKAITTIINKYTKPIHKNINSKDKSGRSYYNEIRLKLYNAVLKIVRDYRDDLEKEFQVFNVDEVKKEHLSKLDTVVETLLTDIENQVIGLYNNSRVKFIEISVSKQSKGNSNSSLSKDIIKETLTLYINEFYKFYLKYQESNYPKTKLLNHIQCSSYEDFVEQLPHESVDLILTDSPYFIAIEDWDLELPIEKRREFFLKYFQKIAHVCKYNTKLIFFNDFQNVEIINDCIKQVTADINYPAFNFALIDTLEWVKSNPVSKSYRGSEYIVFAINNLDGSVHQTAKFQKMIEEQREIYLGISRDLLRESDGRIHATTKSYSLLNELILRFSDANDVVLDTFSGSGAIAMSCYENQRFYYACEIDKFMWLMSVNRLNYFKEKVAARPYPLQHNIYVNEFVNNPIIEKYAPYIKKNYTYVVEDLNDENKWNYINKVIPIIYKKIPSDIEKEGQEIPTNLRLLVKDLSDDEIGFILGFMQDYLDRDSAKLGERQGKNLKLDRILRVYYRCFQPFIINVNSTVDLYKFNGNALKNYRNKSAINRLQANEEYIEYLNQLVNDLLIHEDYVQHLVLQKNLSILGGETGQITDYYQYLTMILYYRQILISKTPMYLEKVYDSDRRTYTNIQTTRKILKFFSYEYLDVEKAEKLSKYLLYNQNLSENGINAMEAKTDFSVNKEVIKSAENGYKNVGLHGLSIENISKPAELGIQLGLDFVFKECLKVPHFIYQLDAKFIYNHLKLVNDEKIKYTKSFILFDLEHKDKQRNTPYYKKKLLSTYIKKQFNKRVFEDTPHKNKNYFSENVEFDKLIPEFAELKEVQYSLMQQILSEIGQ
ncbi:DNA methyltransferase [Enterococcus plantarum]|uniref:DNA methyltransferase n=1 Tax=Enterococcus plantarum TaxID=1077675 RepID=UPI001A90C49C|nr:DNA methyltransferase [Enterococcus plantarum]MBO0423579.1 site-specific DNA-methyltransferase [Enterococcus plantarum]